MLRASLLTSRQAGEVDRWIATLPVSLDRFSGQLQASRSQHVKSPLLAFLTSDAVPAATLRAGEPHTFEDGYGTHIVTLTQAAIDHLRFQGASIDFKRGKLQAGSREVASVFKRGAEEFTTQTGKPAPAWVLRDTDGDFVVPENFELDVIDGTLAPRGSDCHIVAECYPDEVPWQVTWKTAPVAPNTEFIKRKLDDKLTVEASTVADLEGGCKQVDLVLGRQLQRRQDELTSLRATLGQLAPESDAFATAMARYTTLVSIRTLVIVTPRDSDMYSLPQLSEVMKTFKPSRTEAATSLLLGDGEDRRLHVILLKAEALEGETAPVANLHELYHALHARLPQETRDQIDALYERTKRECGPFARMYGRERGEFWTTFAELFEGLHGDAGRQWFKDKQPELWAIMCDVTGRSPI